ncbi:TPA: FAD-dependent thymidylate synthase [Candidatus Micrarchaeota archaeon]|nr:FAD-dependent thymidylate synthase [Candidatus Micrarchaeota archaeon]
MAKNREGIPVRVELLFITPEAEALIARCARVSHRSEARASPEADRELVRKLIAWGHESVLEFASAAFLVEGMSRAAANQLTRHRLASFVQESQRFVDVRDRGLVRPPSFTGEQWEAARALHRRAAELYRELISRGVPKEDARYVLPIGTETRLVVSANFREWRHIIRLRGSKAAQWEIRRFAREVLRVLREHAPAVFGDLEVAE